MSDASSKRPGVGIAVIITCGSYPNSVVLGKRKSVLGKGLYQLPGGHLEFGETLEEAASREVLEETGLEIKNVKFYHVQNTVELENKYHYVTIFMKGEITNTSSNQPQNLEPDKCEGWSWTQWNDMPSAENLFWPLRDLHTSGKNPFSK